MVAFSKNPLSKNQPRYSTSVRPLKTFFFNASFVEIVFLLLFFSVSSSLAQTTTATFDTARSVSELANMADSLRESVTNFKLPD